MLSVRSHTSWELPHTPTCSCNLLTTTITTATAATTNTLQECYACGYTSWELSHTPACSSNIAATTFHATASYTYHTHKQHFLPDLFCFKIFSLSSTSVSLLHQLLEDNWQTIRDEALSQLNTKTASFQPEAESLLDKGDWKQLTLYQQGQCNFFPSGTSSVGHDPYLHFAWIWFGFMGA